MSSRYIFNSGKQTKRQSYLYSINNLSFLLHNGNLQSHHHSCMHAIYLAKDVKSITTFRSVMNTEIGYNCRKESCWLFIHIDGYQYNAFSSFWEFINVELFLGNFIAFASHLIRVAWKHSDNFDSKKWLLLNDKKYLIWWCCASLLLI